jgi:[acyl-carrier-protein] S-malonyltransferase
MIMTKFYKRIACLFPGQGAQYVGMASDFCSNFSAARLTFEEADTLLDRPLSSVILNGPEDSLTETRNSQPAIYVASMAIFRVIQELFEIKPYLCAGLSLGEYTALTAGGWLSFLKTLPLVQMRGDFMNEACEATKGTMAVVMGLEGEKVEEIVHALNMPHELWIANYNCPGQVVISGTAKAIDAATAAAKAGGAKRVLPLQVHGAFHSGLMHLAENKLSPYIKNAFFLQGESALVMNVPGDFVSDLTQLRHNLTKQVTHSVRWEQGIRRMEDDHVDLYVEIGPGTTLSGMNKRIGVKAPTVSIGTVKDLDQLSKMIREGDHAR